MMHDDEGLFLFGTSADPSVGVELHGTLIFHSYRLNIFFSYTATQHTFVSLLPEKKKE